MYLVVLVFDERRIDMGRYCGPKIKLSRSLEVPIAETPKHLTLRREKRPGQHGYRRGRRSLYALQLREKQRIAFYYNIRNNQLRHYKKLAGSSVHSTREALQEILESRFDNVIRRLHWARTIWQARQMVVHGHFLVNGRKVDKASFHVKQGDVISVKNRSLSFIQRCAESADEVGFRVPDWLSIDKEKLQATVLHLPAFEEVCLPFEVDYGRIVEFYTR